MGNGNLKTKAEIMDSIRRLKEELKKNEAELAEVEKKEYHSSLDGFIERFGLKTSDDVLRLQKALEGIEGSMRKGGNSVGATAEARPPETVTEANGRGEPADPDPVDLMPPDPFEPGNMEIVAEDETETVSLEEPPSQVAAAPLEEPDPVEENSSTQHEDSTGAGDETADIDYWPIFSEAFGAAAPEPMEDTSGPGAGSDKAPFSAPGNSAKAEETWPLSDADMSIFDELPVYAENNLGMVDPAIGAVLDPDFEIPVDRDATGIDPALIVSTPNPDPTVTRYKSRPVVADAERKLIEAIAAAVYEGWVKKEDILERFFKITEETGDSYRNAQQICEKLSAVWETAGVNGSVSEGLIKEFLLFPFHVGCKAVICARSDLQAHLGNRVGGGD